MDIELLMENDFSKIEKFFCDNKDKLQKLRNGILSLKNINEFTFIVDDLVFAYDILISLKYCADNIHEHYFNLTTFISLNTSNIYIIHEKMDKLIKANNMCMDINVQAYVSLFETEWKNIKSFRNCNEHALSSHFSNNYRKVYTNVNLDKQIRYFISVIDVLRKITVKKSKKKYDILQTSPISLRDRKRLMSANACKYKNLQFMMSELSFQIIRERIVGEIPFLIFDIIISYDNISKAIELTFNPIDKEGLLEDSDMFYERIAISLEYQLFDKLGNWYCQTGVVKSNITYLSAVGEIIKSNGLNDEISNRIIDLINATEYRDIRLCRNDIEHKQVKIDYFSSDEQIKSMLILCYVRLTDILLSLVEGYFEKEDIVISEKAFEEINNITKKVLI